jgi:hypothetical protein
MPSEVTVRVILREKGGLLDSPLRIVLGYTALHIERRYGVDHYRHQRGADGITAGSMAPSRGRHRELDDYRCHCGRRTSSVGKLSRIRSLTK